VVDDNRLDRRIDFNLLAQTSRVVIDVDLKHVVGTKHQVIVLAKESKPIYQKQR